MSGSNYQAFTQSPEGEQAQRLQQAVAFFKKNLQTAPHDVSAMHALGVIQCQLGQSEDGIAWLEKALKLSPANADILYHYGVALLPMRRFAEAMKSFQTMVKIDPQNAEGFYHLGMAQSECGLMVEAEMSYRKALELKPDYVEALNNLGNLYSDHKQYNEALDCYHRAMKAQPNYVMPYNNMGLTLVSLGKLDEAERHYRHALSIMPNYPEALNNLGIVYRMRGQFDESAQFTLQALALRAEYPEALNNLGNVYKDLGEMDKAIAAYRKAIAMKDNGDYRHNLSLALLAAGQWEEGWQEYEKRWETRQLSVAQRRFPVPDWRGEPAAGKKLLITYEQGLGDSLQFCRYASIAQQMGIGVIVEVPPTLKRIIATAPGVAQSVARGETLPPFDMHCPMMSLPFAFKTLVENIPAPVAYLFADPAEIDVWKNRLALPEKKFRVGLVWAGSSRLHAPDLAATDRRRSLSPDMLAPLLSVEGAEFYSLQKIGNAMPAEYKVYDYMNLCHDFADTAAFVANLDLVISVDTAMVHLTGGMGKPVWMLNRFDSCWRWLQQREDSRWYPTMRIFRQSAPGDWASVIERMRDALEKQIGSK